MTGEAVVTGEAGGDRAVSELSGVSGGCESSDGRFVGAAQT